MRAGSGAPGANPRGAGFEAAGGYTWSVLFALALLALPDQYDRAAEKVRFPDDEVLRQWSAKSDAHRKVVALISDRSHWARAFQAVDEKLGLLPANPEIRVTLEETDDKRPACSSGKDGRGIVRFNLRQLVPYQEKLDEVAEIEKSGRKVRWAVPPTRMEGVIPHEVAHVVCGGFQDLWVAEGLASFAAGEDVAFYQFNLRKGRIDSLDRGVTEDDSYARGLSFLRWLEKDHGADAVRAFARKVSREGVAPSRAAADISGLAWEKVVVQEKAWALEYIAGFKPSP